MRKRSLLFPSFLAFSLVACQSTEETVPMVGPTAVEPATASAVPAAMPAANPFAAPQDDLADQFERRRQQLRFLVEQYLATGDGQSERGDIEGALASYSNAVDLDPSNQEARQRLRDAYAMLGKPFAGGANLAEDMADQEVVRRSLGRLEAQKHMTDGDNQRRLGNPDAAIQSYRRGLMILKNIPSIADGSLDEQMFEAKIQASAAEGDEMEQRARSERERLAAEEAAAKEAEARDYKENKLREFYRESNAAFHSQKYGTAETLADQILRVDPGNEAATKMRDIAREAKHLKRDEQLSKTKREQWILTMEEVSTMGVAMTDVVNYDFERWTEVQARTPIVIPTGDQVSLADNAAVLGRLSEQRVVPRFGEDGEGADISEIAEYLSQVTGIDFLVSPSVIDELDDEERAISMDLSERSVKKTLDLIAELRENLKWKVADGVVKFVTAEELTGGQVLDFYEVRDLIRPVVDFPAQEINISPSGGPPEIDDEPEEREALVITEDTLDALIRDNISPTSWDDESAALKISNGTMVVNQTPEVHKQIKRLLDDLREATGIMVDIQTRFLTVQDNFLEDIGVDFRGLGTPGLGTNQFFNDFGDATAQQSLGAEIGQDTDLGAFYQDGNGDLRARAENLFDQFLGDGDVLTGTGGLSFQWTYLNDLQLQMILRAVSKSERVELVTAPRLLVFNTARSNVTVTNQVAYVQDYDVEIAQAASIADPIISVVQDGVILDVRPVVSADRRYITLELRPTVATLKRPIDTLVTSLGVSGNSVVIQLPEIDISRVRTSVPMPDGGTVLLGGFKVHESRDLRSGVPILNKIPLIRFLFERKGNYVTNRKLLVLLKANIVILDEKAPTPAQLGLAESLLPKPN